MKNKIFSMDNFQGKLVNIQLVLTEAISEQHLLDKRYKLIDNEVKLNFPLLDAFKLMYNVTINYVIDYCEYNKTSINDNHLESCVIRKLINKEADISANPLLITHENLLHLDFPGISTFGRSKILFRKPKLSLITNVYTLPFTMDVWLASFALILLTISFLYLLTQWQYYKNSKQDIVPNNKEKLQLEELNCDEELPDSLLEVSFIAVCAVSQQGPEKKPNGLHGKTITWLFFLAFMFLYVAYSANIVALLQATSSEIQSLHDLVESSMEVGMHDCLLYRRVLSNVRGEDRIHMLSKKHIKIMKNDQELWHFVNVTDGIEKVRDEMYAFHVETNIGYTIIEQTFDEVEKCGLQEVQFLQFPTDLYFPIKKRSPFAEMFKIGFLRLRETGIQYREDSLMRTPKPRCWTLDTNFVSVGLVDCYFATALYAGGLLLALGIFFVEVFVSQIYKGKTKMIKL